MNDRAEQAFRDAFAEHGAEDFEPVQPPRRRFDARWAVAAVVALVVLAVPTVIFLAGRGGDANTPVVAEPANSSASPGSDTVRELRRAATLGPARTPHQDVGFALQQLVEIAVRGLASGSNDPYTAVQAIDGLSVLFCALATHPLGYHVARDPTGCGRLRQVLSVPA